MKSNNGRFGLISNVKDDSLAAAVGIRPGDRVLSINGKPLHDMLDYQFQSAEEAITVKILRGDEERQVSVEKYPDEDLGIEFDTATLGDAKHCRNNCFFCFVKGLPDNLRSGLYSKDDDYRLSFLYGNFITLTNMAEADWERLVEQRLSPLYLSVHATNLELRRKMMGNPKAPDILQQIRRLGQIRIQVHTQVVLCPGINDGDNLKQTVDALASLYPTVQSIGIVPVGITDHRSKYVGTSRYSPADWEPVPCTREIARSVIKQVSPWQKEFRRRFATSLVYLADEYYIMAGKNLPSSEWYDEFPQYQNGIGMTRTLLDSWSYTRRRLKSLKKQGRELRIQSPTRVIMASGKLIEPVMSKIIAELNQLDRLTIELVPTENNFFGKTVKVSGLLTASDLIANRDRLTNGDLLLLPENMINPTSGQTLDDYSQNGLEKALGIRISCAEMPHHLLKSLANKQPGEDRQCAALSVTSGPGLPAPPS